jgi:TRAP transporter 4TM/12TM fusion protein
MSVMVIRWILMIAGFLGVLLSISHLFYLSIFGMLELENSYAYLFMAFFLSTVFLTSPLQKEGGKRKNIAAWVDTGLFLVTVFICIFFAIKGYDFLMIGWSYHAPAHIVVFRTILWLLIMEATRRVGGTFFCLIATFFALYPLFANHLPGILEGAGFGFNYTIAYHILSADSALGIPMKVLGDILVSYLIFGSVLGITGASDFFLNLAMCLLGHTRGGVAKVAVIASGIFGSINGSAVANVLTIGTITIPLMKKIGYPAHFAGAVEACASNGGQLMPPVMGAVAFVMAAFLNISYGKVAVAAIIPALLYYFGLLVQVDGRAVALKLGGLPKTQIPSLKKVLKEGWYYSFALIILIVLLYYGKETQAPIYTSVFLLFISALKKKTRPNIAKMEDFLTNFAKTMIQLVAVLAAVGMIMGSLSITGVAHAFPSEILKLAGGNLWLLLFLTAIASFIMGMGMPAIPIYIFTAVIIAPSLADMGLNTMAVHMFLLYCGLLSFITPPVCVAVYPAAALAGASIMKTGWASMRLGAVLFIIPFFFVVEPALVLQGPFLKVLYTSMTAFFGVWLLASSLEGYLAWVGPFGARNDDNKFEWCFNNALRGLLFISGFLFVIPGFWTDLAGFLLAIAIVPLQFRLNRRAETLPKSESPPLSRSTPA